MLRNRLFIVLLGLGLLSACQVSKVEESPPDPLASPSVEGEWQMISIRPEADFRADPNTNNALRLSLTANERGLGRGRVQLPRWVFQSDGKVYLRWPAVAGLPRRTRNAGTYHRSTFNHQTMIRTKVGTPPLAASFSGDTLVIHDATNHLLTRLLPVY